MRKVAAAVSIICILAGVSAWAVVTKVPPPKNEAELKKMFRYTYGQEVLPEGASAETLARLLERGEVVLMNDNPPTGVPWIIAAGMMIDAPAEGVFKVVTDFARYPEVVPMTSSAIAVPVPAMPNLYKVTFNIDILFSWLSIEYSVYHYHRPPYRTDWAHAEGEFDINSGFWQLIPADGGKRSMAFYSVYSLPQQETLRNLYKEEPSLELMTNVATATMVVQAVKAESEKQAAVKLKPLKEPKSVDKILLEDPRTMRLLAEKGKVLVLEPGPTVYTVSGAVVPTSCEAAFSVVSDFAHYTDFLPGVRKVELRGKGPKGGLKVYQEISMQVWEFDFNAAREYEYLMVPNQSISWTITRGDGSTAPGYWKFLPLDDNKKCLMFTGGTEDIRDMGIIPRTALRIYPTLEYGLMASMSTTAMDAFKKRIKIKAGQ